MPSLTFRVVAGLGQGLAVSQHGHTGHGDTHDTALFAGLVLHRREKSQGQIRQEVKPQNPCENEVFF